MEAAHWLTTGTLLKFSEQQLVDCANLKHGYGNYGCNGGLQQYAFNYYETNDAVLEENYSYTAMNGTCMYDSDAKTNVEVNSYKMVTANSSAQTKAAIIVQPISVSIEADKTVFQMYSSGVFDSAKCGTQLDHAVALVGFGVDASAGAYYILRNSWGTTWGEEGYMKIAVTGNDAGICGVQSEPLYPATN